MMLRRGAERIDEGLEQWQESVVWEVNKAPGSLRVAADGALQLFDRVFVLKGIKRTHFYGPQPVDARAEALYRHLEQLLQRGQHEIVAFLAQQARRIRRRSSPPPSRRAQPTRVWRGKALRRWEGQRLSPKQFACASALDQAFRRATALGQQARQLVRDLDRALTPDSPVTAGPKSSYSVFIGSSAESLPIAECACVSLAGPLDGPGSPQILPVLWRDVFSAGTYTLETIEDHASRFDFAVFVFAPDDTTTSRAKRHPVTRDNVLFELGVWVGRLSHRRALVLAAQAVKLPSDLAGLTTARYDPQAVDQTGTPALSPACADLRRAMRKAIHAALPAA